MKSKSLSIFAIIVVSTMLSPIFLNLNVVPSHNDNSINDIEPNIEKALDTIKKADTSFDDQINTAETIALWLRNEWLNNTFNRSNVIRLGQDGVSSVGKFLIELYKKTANSNYLNWAKDIANWLIIQHGILGYPAGKWPNKISGSDVSNFTGFDQGSAGIGSFFINLYNVSTSDTQYLAEARDVYAYLNSQAQTTPTGLSWLEKDNLAYTNQVAYVTTNTTYNGTVGGGTLSDVNVYDGTTYDIDDVNQATQTDYRISLNPLIPSEYFGFIDQFMTDLTVSISVRASAGTGDVMVYNAGNGSWVSITGGSPITSTETTYTQSFSSSFYNWTSVGAGAVIVKVNTSGAGHTTYVDALNVTIDYNDSYNSSSFATGAAGIGSFYLDMHNSDWGNQTLLDKAEKAANFTLEEVVEYGQYAAWQEKGRFYTGLRQGAAGIGSFLLRLKQITGKTSFQTYANKSANWLVSNNASVVGLFLEGPSLFWGAYNKSSHFLSEILPGMDYCAGIGQFLLDLGQDIGGNNSHMINARYVANGLINANLNHMVQTESLFDRVVFYKWRSGTQADYRYSTATAGALEFLDNIFMDSPARNYTTALSRGMEWIFKTIDIQNGTWGGINTLYAISDGLAGVGYSLLSLNVKKPSITSVLTPNSYEFNDTARVEFDFQGYGANISRLNTEIRYAYGLNYILGTWDYDVLKNVSMIGDSYYFDEFTGVSHNNTWHYAIFVVDSNGTFSFDNNGSEYLMDILDSYAPATDLVPLYGEGIGAGASGTLELRVEKNKLRGANFSRVVVNIPQLGPSFTNIIISNTSIFWYSDGDDMVYPFQIDVGTALTFGTTIIVTVTTYDEINNQLITVETFSVTDTIAPTLTEVEIYSIRWIPQFTPVKVEAKATDVGAGIDDNTGVFVKYTTDEGRTWQVVYLVKTGTKYVGEIPGQFLLSEIYYVVGVVDKGGNEIIYDTFSTTYSSIEDIPLYAMYQYQIILNWFVLLALLTIIGVVTVLSYLIYSRRGGYLEKMRRKSKAAATGIAIKERLTNFYYNLVESMNNISEKISKRLSGGGGKIWLWFEEHLGERPKKVLGGIGRLLYAIPKGIFSGIGAFFSGIGKLITKSKGWQLIAYIGLGFLLVITTVIQFFMEAGYPIRGVFFANLGFFMFLSGIVAYLIRFIYKLSYK